MFLVFAGEIYCAKYQGNLYAVKVEKLTKVGGLETEIRILRALQGAHIWH